MLQVQNIEKYYGSKNNVTKALDRVSFDVEAGEFLAIMGASGSGKTTLLNCISTIDTISAGKILLDGVSVAGLSESELAKFRRERLGFVFQDFNLLDPDAFIIATVYAAQGVMDQLVYFFEQTIERPQMGMRMN